MKSQWKNVLIGAVGNLGAKAIGGMAHGSIDANGNYVSPQIDKATQLILHAGLGAATARLGGNDALSGAVSGVVGELIAETATNAGLDRNQSIQVSGVVGGASAILTGNLTGQDDEEIANNIFSGQRIASNAAENNALLIGGKVKIPLSDFVTGKGKDYDIHSGLKIGLGLTEKSIGTDGAGNAFYLVPEFGLGGYINLTPHSENVDKSFSLGYRNTISIDYLRTDQSHSGYGVTFGVSTSPYTVIPVNIIVNKPGN